MCSVQHDQTVSSVGFRLEGEMNLGQLELWLSRLLKDQGPQLFRYKVRDVTAPLSMGWGGKGRTSQHHTVPHHIT